MNPINILHIIDTSGPGGAEKIVFDLIRNKCDRFKLHLILPDQGWLYTKLNGIEDVVIDTINGHGRFNIKYLIQLINYVTNHKIDIIHAHLYGVSSYCGLVSLFTRIPMICTLHGMAGIPGKLKLKIISETAAMIVFVSDHLREQFLKTINVNREKTEVIYNGINYNDFQSSSVNSIRREFDFNEDDILIGAVGNITPAKGYDVLIKAAAKACRNNPNYRFLIAGEKRGKLFRDLRELSNSLGLNNNVYFIGYREDVCSFLREIDLFVLPSITEGFSLATIEAMAVGVPVIATTSGGPSEIINHNINGRLIPPGDTNAIISDIVYLLNNKDLADILVRNAKQTVKTKYNIESMISKYNKMYYKVTT